MQVFSLQVFPFQFYNFWSLPCSSGRLLLCWRHHGNYLWLVLCGCANDAYMPEGIDRAPGWRCGHNCWTIWELTTQGCHLEASFMMQGLTWTWHQGAESALWLTPQPGNGVYFLGFVCSKGTCVSEPIYIKWNAQKAHVNVKSEQSVLDTTKIVSS